MYNANNLYITKKTFKSDIVFQQKANSLICKVATGADLLHHVYIG